MCVYFCVVACVDDTNGKEVCKKKRRDATIKNKNKKKNNRPTVRFFFSLSSYGKK